MRVEVMGSTEGVKGFLVEEGWRKISVFSCFVEYGLLLLFQFFSLKVVFWLRGGGGFCVPCCWGSQG